MLSPVYKLLLPVLLISLWPSHVSASDEGIQTSKIGVLAFRGAEKAHKRWDAIAEYLSSQIEGYQFQIQTYDLEGMDQAVANKEIDFVLTNPGNYVRLETLFGATRITTLSKLYKNKSYTIYGAVIFSKSSRKDINDLQDLRGRSFMAVSERAFGGFQMAWYELSLTNIDPFRDFSKLIFSGFPQDKIVMAVANGEVDAGTVRAETLERMINENKIRREDIHIINPRFANEYPFRHSTRLYPEWAFAKLKHADDSLAQQVAVSLLTQKSGSITSKASNINGWTIPLDYSRVHDTFRHLKIEPYANTGEINLADVWKKYGPWIVLTFFVLILLTVTIIYISSMNRRLSSSGLALEKEVEERKQAEAKLARHGGMLEETVSQRTLELRSVNLELEKDIQARKQVEETLRSSELALRKLYEITSATHLDFDQKIRALLIFGTDFLHIPHALFLKKEQENYIVLQDARTSTLSEGEYTAEDEPCCYGSVITVHDKHYGALCFIETKPLSLSFTRVDEDILQLMAQWISGELERKEAEEKALQHQNELAHVSRLGTMGEMASGLAHELNQPLTAIANYTRGCIRRLHGEHPDMPAIIAAIDHSANEAERAAKIIKRLRDFVSKGDITKETVNINDVIQMAIDISAADIKLYQIDLQLNLAQNLPLVQADHIQLEQVVLNLLRNSIESMQNIPDMRIVRLSSEFKEDKIIVRVCDSGPGIDDDTNNHLFHPFFTTKTEGMGMGLSISRSIIEAHGGQLDYIPEDKAGPENKSGFCQFQFMIPTE